MRTPHHPDGQLIRLFKGKYSVWVYRISGRISGTLVCDRFGFVCGVYDRLR